MIPYFPQPEFHLFGPITVHAFGAIVAVALIVGWKMAVARCRTKGLDPEIFEDLLLYVVLSGFVVAHLYSVLAYFPREAMEDPLLLLKFWEDISSFGGFVGGLFGLWLFSASRRGMSARRTGGDTWTPSRTSARSRGRSAALPARSPTTTPARSRRSRWESA